MTTFNEENNAETKASFSNALAERAKSKKGPTTERAKYQISKNNIKNGFCSKRFIIYGENIVSSVDFHRAFFCGYTMTPSHHITIIWLR